MTGEHLTIRQAAAKLHCHRNTVWRWIRAGFLKAVGATTRTKRVPRSEVERLLKAGGKS